jgi:hypothetical protein
MFAARLPTSGPSATETQAAPPSSGVRLAHLVDARWEPASDAGRRAGEVSTNETLRLAAGLARLEFDGGAAVTLEGPAEFTVVDGRRGSLRRGRLTAVAPAAAIGFRIDTPSSTVIDLGTAFGVNADATGATQVEVFSGEIVVALTGAAAAPNKRTLAEGAAVRIDAASRRIADVPFDGSAYLRSWPLAFGVTASSGSVKFVEPIPQVVPRRYQDDRHLVVFPEREAVTLRRDLEVAVTTPGSYDGPFDPAAHRIAAGTRVRSFLLQFNPRGRDAEAVRRLSGSITFDRPIVGLICTKKELNDVDGLFALKPSWRPAGGGGVEAGDTVTLSPDRRTLSVLLTAAPAHDQLRILVEVPVSNRELASRR